MTFADIYLNQKSFYLTKEAATIHKQSKKTNMRNFQQTILKCQPSSNKELLKALFDEKANVIKAARNRQDFIQLVYCIIIHLSFLNCC